MEIYSQEINFHRIHLKPINLCKSEVQIFFVINFSQNITVPLIEKIKNTIFSVIEEFDDTKG